MLSSCLLISTPFSVLLQISVTIVGFWVCLCGVHVYNWRSSSSNHSSYKNKHNTDNITMDVYLLKVFDYVNVFLSSFCTPTSWSQSQKGVAYSPNIRQRPNVLYFILKFALSGISIVWGSLVWACIITRTKLSPLPLCQAQITSAPRQRLRYTNIKWHCKETGCCYLMGRLLNLLGIIITIYSLPFSEQNVQAFCLQACLRYIPTYNFRTGMLLFDILLMRLDIL